MEHKNAEIVTCQMMIRKPISMVFNAFVDPQITTNFWFTKSSGKLEKGKTVIWSWEMYNHSLEVLPVEVIQNEKISIEWGQPATTVDIEFELLAENQTYVTIKCYGFQATGDELLEIIKDRTGGFTTVLDGLKAYLEHNINLNLIADKYPKTSLDK